jgi:hypothetical protein
MTTTKLAEALRLGIEALTCAGSNAECQSLEVYAKEQMREALASYEAEAKPASCTCPSGDGSLRWPCPAHPSEAKPAVPVADGCQVVHVVMKDDGTIRLKKGDRSTWVGFKSDDKADQEWRAGCISRLLGHSGWDAAAPAAPADLAQTIRGITEAYRGTDCGKCAESIGDRLIEVIAAPAAPAQHPDTQDAERLRYLLSDDGDWTLCEWDHDAGYWVSDQREPDVVRAAIDAAIAASKGENNGQ